MPHCKRFHYQTMDDVRRKVPCPQCQAEVRRIAEDHPSDAFLNPLSPLNTITDTYSTLSSDFSTSDPTPTDTSSFDFGGSSDGFSGGGGGSDF